MRSVQSGGKNPLLALGSAAVLAVYFAGWSRTREAQAALDAQERMPVQRGRGGGSAAAQRPEAQADSALPKPAATAMAVKATGTRQLVAPPASSPAPSAIAVAVPSKAPVADSVVAPAKAAPVDTAAAIAADTVHADSAVAAPRFRDGVYSGWGTSRHGDIEAAVEIKGGKIIAAWVTQCLTRYSCSWISALPPQVVSRQSADVDFVSGATQSANAFYSAILEALTRAK